MNRKERLASIEASIRGRIHEIERMTQEVSELLDGLVSLYLTTKAKKTKKRRISVQRRSAGGGLWPSLDQNLKNLKRLLSQRPKG